jgi:CheY-like chemotaxis protein
VTTILTDGGFKVASNTVASTAISRVKAQIPDFVLIDLQMEEMDGLELCEELRSYRPLDNTKIIMVSAHTGEVWKQKANEAGADGYIEKPIDQTTLAETIKGILAG